MYMYVLYYYSGWREEGTRSCEERRQEKNRTAETALKKSRKYTPNCILAFISPDCIHCCYLYRHFSSLLLSKWERYLSLTQLQSRVSGEKKTVYDVKKKQRNPLLTLYPWKGRSLESSFILKKIINYTMYLIKFILINEYEIW